MRGARQICVSAAFATMPIKVIFSVLLRNFTFEKAQPSVDYPNGSSATTRATAFSRRSAS